jgi:hypothetical protein
MPASAMMPIPGMPMPSQGKASQVLFASPEGMEVRWDTTGSGTFDSDPLIMPGRYNFPQGGIYRLKLTNIEGREGTELYPTMEIGPATPRTEAFLAHNAIPIQFTEEDLDQVLTGNFVTKVIYLPDPRFQELALAGVETLVSTRLEPGVNPVVEADRRGAILAILRLGNKDLEMPGDAGQNAAGETGSVMPVGYYSGWMPPALPAHRPPPGGGGLPPNYVAGMTVPQYGMPITGTPIGLPGPPHIPLGGPAGLKSHTMVNHTHMHIPEPTKHLRIDVEQQPGLSYPKPPNKAWIIQQSIHPGHRLKQPKGNKFQLVQ